MQKYTQKEINEILLSKKLNQFYFAMLEKREVRLTDDEFSRFVSAEKSDIETGKHISKIFDRIINTKAISKLIKESMGEINYRWATILTMLDDITIYDVLNRRIIDISREKIIHYDNLKNYFNETMVRVKLFDSKDSPELIEETAMIDINDDCFNTFHYYEFAHRNQKEDEDLSSQFIVEYKNSSC